MTQSNRPSVSLKSEAKRLYDAGWAVHWLMTREKRPLKAWKGDSRASWAELERDYRPDLNLGVKLGRPSRLTGGFLACLDCDVKSNDPAHRLEMEKRLDELFPDDTLDTALTVSSGRGLGSRHIYGVTSQPAQPRKLAQSRDEVRVIMPSVAPSRRERDILSDDDIRAGVHLRPAWEICLMGQGQQMALPPSIHPDSGRRYVWDNAGYMDLPSFDSVVGSDERAEKDASKSEPFTSVDVDLLGDTRITDELVNLVTETPQGDRSAVLYKVAAKLSDAGLTDQEVLSVLTDPTNGLGVVAYDHIQKPRELKYRARAARWVYEHTLAKAKKQIGREASFDAFESDADVPANAELSDEDAEAQEKELTHIHAGNWMARLQTTQQRTLKNTLFNAKLILMFDTPGVIGRNMFTGYDVYRAAPPWGGKEGTEVNDIELTSIRLWMSEKHGIEPSRANIDEAVSYVATRNPFNPVADYLDTLVWDGVPRVDRWLENYMNARGPSEYLRAVSRKTLCALIGRATRPGLQFDSVLILEGKQGVGKSSSLRRLVPEGYFSDAQLNIQDKDAVLAMRGIWLYEMGELSSMKRGDVDQLKEFISRREDRIRVPYGRRAESFARRCVFIGTTNSAEYFKDVTGNRRFWPVEVGDSCDWDGIERDRDQLFAEARWYFDMGESLYLDSKLTATQAREEQEKRTVGDEWVDVLNTWFDLEAKKPESERALNLSLFTMRELFGDGGPFEGARMDKHQQMRVGECLRAMKCVRTLKRVNGIPTKVWRYTHKTRDFRAVT